MSGKECLLLKSACGFLWVGCKKQCTAGDVAKHMEKGMGDHFFKVAGVVKELKESNSKLEKDNEE